MSEDFFDLENNIGEKVSITGKISNVMWQHFHTYVKTHPHIGYIDLDETHQIVVYTKNPIECNGVVHLTGKLIKTKYKSDSPDQKI